MRIVNVLRGGLGNQLFQWAISKFLEEKYNCEVYQDVREYDYKNYENKITKRKFALTDFPNIEYKLLTEHNINELKNWNLIELNEKNFNPILSILNKSNNYKLFDYWQNYRYFYEINEIISNQLKIPQTKEKEFYLKYPDLNRNTISIHVRRTDYQLSNGFHPIQPISYFENAVKILGDYDKILIFSDDLDWCKNNFKFKNQIFINSESDIDDFWLMSLCKNNIISNSSFSWWAAWLNENKNKKIIRPKLWFSFGDVPNMSPESWIKI